MVNFKLSVLTALAFSVVLLVNAAPTDGLTRRAPKVLGLDFDVKRVSLNSTEPLVERSQAYDSTIINEQAYYITYLLLGQSQTKIGVDIDTGSSDLWVPSNSLSGSVVGYGSFDPSSSNDLGEQFSIGYGDGTKSTGEFYLDRVALGDGSAPLSNFQFAVVDQTSVSQSGVFGIGLASLEAGNMYGTQPIYDNFPVALKKAGYIDNMIYSLYLNDASATSGSLLIGGKDTAKYEGEIVYLDHSGPSQRLDATVETITFNGVDIPFNAPANFDSGTTLLFFTSDIRNAILNSLGWDGFSAYKGFAIITQGPPPGTFDFNFNGVTIKVPNEDIIVSAGPGVWAVLIGEQDSNILGDSFLRHAYVVYDLENSSIGLAPVKYTTDSNIVSL